MEYPIWHLGALGGGFWIALIGTFHVFLAHFAVGGGLYLVLSEIYARRLKSPVLLAHVKKHTRFFLLITMVAGGVTGVGIWFIIGLLSPQATSTLIKVFVYGFATEWVFFLGEIVALLIYYYGFDRMDPADHIRMGWFYFLFAFLSLVTINGIIGFMLTPGQWITTRNFWHGILNPTFWPQLALRTGICLSLAGLFGFVTATRIGDEVSRERMVRMAAAWTILPLLVCLGAGWWYIQALPEAQFEMVMLRSERAFPASSSTSRSSPGWPPWARWFWPCARPAASASPWRSSCCSRAGASSAASSSCAKPPASPSSSMTTPIPTASALARKKPPAPRATWPRPSGRACAK